MAEHVEPGGSGESRSESWLQIHSSRGFVDWLAQEGVSLGCTTYQAGKLILLGRNAERKLSIVERTFPSCMGLWGNGRRMWMSSLGQIWRFENALGPGQLHQGYDRVYVPRVGYTTGDLDVHDLAEDVSGRLVFVNTRFSCLASLSSTASFTPLWQPSHLSQLAPDDRCHLNGLALQDGIPFYVTLASLSDVVEGWRDHRRDGGCVLELPGGEVIARGLSLPHSPRVHRDQLWIHNSGTGEFGCVDPRTGVFEAITFCPGYLRGLAFSGDWAIAGLSRPRRNSAFDGLVLGERLEFERAEARCGLVVIDLRTGHIVHWAWFEGDVSELYDVIVLPGTARPLVLGFKTSEVFNFLSVDAGGRL